MDAQIEAYEDEMAFSFEFGDFPRWNYLRVKLTELLKEKNNAERKNA